MHLTDVILKIKLTSNPCYYNIRMYCTHLFVSKVVFIIHVTCAMLQWIECSKQKSKCVLNQRLVWAVASSELFVHQTSFSWMINVENKVMLAPRWASACSDKDVSGHNCEAMWTCEATEIITLVIY